MKRIITLIAFAAVVAAAVTSCKDRFKTDTEGTGGPKVSSVELNKHEETLTVPGGTIQLSATVYPEDAGIKNVQWSSSKESVATVDQNGLVTAHRPGNADITVTSVDGGKTDVCHLIVKGPDPEAVDLGLSVKWANMNVGALNESDAGNYYAWGEVTIKNLYYKTNYKYNVDISNPPTPPSVLPASEDAAAVNLGGNWRMPTKAEFEELLSSCTWERMPIGAIPVAGWRVSRNGKSIFLPYVGFRDNELHSFNEAGYYCSSTCKNVFQSDNEGRLCSVYGLRITDNYNEEDYHYVGSPIGYYGHPVRAVCP